MVSLPHEKCYAIGGVQTRLVGPALGVLLFYCVGFPAGIWYLFTRHRKVIEQDQLLRATGRGDSYTENSNYEFRKTYSKLYYAYKPSSYFWIEMIILRKFLLVVIGAIFRNNPSFQMATCLMVLFFSLVVQVHRQPFMGYRERAEIVKSSMESRVLRETKELSAMELVQHMGGKTGVKESERIQKKRRQVSQTQYLMESQHRLLYSHHRVCCNYNVVEEVFLVCGVIVNLCGMMFDTTYLKDKQNETTKTVISALTITLIVGSLIYWVVVLVYEICTGAKNKKTRTKLQWAKMRGSARSQGGGLKSRMLAMSKKNAGGGAHAGGAAVTLKPGEVKEDDPQNAFEALDGLFFDLLDEHDDDHDPLLEHGAHMRSMAATQEELLTDLVVKEGTSGENDSSPIAVKVRPAGADGDTRFKPTNALSTMKRLRVKSVREKGMDRKALALTHDDHETMASVLESYRSHEEHLAKQTNIRRNKSMANTMNRVQARRKLKSSKAMRNVEIFSHCDDEQLAKVIDAMSCTSYVKGDKIVKQGERADVFYIITQGSAGVWQKNITNMLRGGAMVGELDALAHFGENALVNAIGEMDGVSDPSKLKEVRNATVVASSPRCTVMALTGNSLRRLLEQGVINKEVLVRSVDDIAAQRDRRTKATRVLKKAVAKRKSKMGGASKTPEVARKVEESRRLLPDSF